MHLMLDEPISTTVCVMQELADILTRAQAVDLANAVRLQEAIGLSITLPPNPKTSIAVTVVVQDLFLATNESVQDQPVLRGIDTNHSIFLCSRINELDTWVISSPSERSTWARCEGDVWIDRLSGVAHLASAATSEGSHVVLRVLLHRRLDEACSFVLRFARMPTMQGGALAFPKILRADEIACWLARLFGPQSAISISKAPSEIELPEGLGSVRLLTDLVLAPGRSLSVRGGDNIVLVGSHQVRIEPGAVLTLESITIAGSVGSSAVAIEAGSVRLRNSVVRNCSVAKNAMNTDGRFESRGGAIYVRAGTLELVSVDVFGNSAEDGEVVSSGGAIFCKGGSSISATRCRLCENVARNAGLANRHLFGTAQGGAIHSSNSSVVILDSELLKNAARDAGYIAQAGAVLGTDGSSLRIRGTKLNENLVENGGVLFTAADLADAGSYGGAIFLCNGAPSSAEVVDCEICGNMARAGAQWNCVGGIGGIYFGYLRIIRSKLQRNIVHGNGAQGGALYVQGGGDLVPIASLTESEISDNRAVATDDGADLAQAGGVYVMMANLTVVDCELHGNTASGGSRALGGAFGFDFGSRVLVYRSDLSDNAASGGSDLTQGGAVWAEIGDSGTLQIESTRLSRNCANSSAAQGETAGGALYLKGSATVIDSDLIANIVSGRTAHGGGVFLYPRGTIIINRTTIRNHLSLSTRVGGEAFGGGLYNAGGMMTLIDSRLLENVASIISPAEQVSAGALFNAVGARSMLDGCLLRSNTAGGMGYFQETNFLYDDDKRMSYEARKAAHIFTSGEAKFVRVIFVDTSNVMPIEHSARVWIVVAGGTAYFHSSNFSAATDSNAQLWLLTSVAPDAEALILQCAVMNLKLQWADKQRVGVVNSDFEPPLDNSIPGMLQPGECGTVVANEQMCGPRALCELRQTAGGVLSGGVQYACVGAGVHEKPGLLTKGQQCELDTIVGMLMQSRAVAITLPKPSNGSVDLRIVVQAVGESRMVAVYSASMVRRSAWARGAVQPSSSRAWSRLDEPQLSLDGHHVLWVMPPSTDTQFDLDLKQQVFSAKKEYVLQLQLDCRGQQPCIADGDKVTTVIEIGDASSPSGQRSAVSITTEVAALVSCQRAMVWVEGGAQSVPSSSAIVVRLRAIDVDAMPIDQTRAEVEFRFGNKTVPVNWNRGSNEYVASVPAELTGQAGEYELVVTATRGWNETLGAVVECVLLEQIIRVDRPVEGFNTSYVILGCAISAAILVVVLLLVARKYRDRFEHIFGTVVVEVFKLTFAWAFEGGDIATDGISFHRTVISNELRVGYILPQRYQIAYIVIMCLAAAAAALSFVNRFRQTRDLLRSIRRRLSNAASAREAPIQAPGMAAKLEQIRWEVTKSKRDLIGVALSAVTVGCEGTLP